MHFIVKDRIMPISFSLLNIFKINDLSLNLFVKIHPLFTFVILFLYFYIFIAMYTCTGAL